MDLKRKYRVIGLMSGTSLDGVDIACSVFRYKNDRWSFRIEKAITVAYTSIWKQKLAEASKLAAPEILQLHVDYGEYLGNLCKKFVRLYGIKKVDFIASHGHTVFHQPEHKFTFQLGDGQALFATSKLPVVFDFRSLDVALGGQGAPLVPVGDHFLFSDYDVCLNLGGIANLSRLVNDKRMAFDICFVNLGLNYLASKANKAYDKQGAMASDGELNQTMLRQLSKIYSGIRPKRPSLGREFFENNLQPVLDRENVPLEDRLHTFTESVAVEITSALTPGKKQISVLCTGGGAFNSYLMYRLVEHCGDSVNLIMPDTDIIKFKEALVFAFLGIKRVRNEINCLKSVTRASRDCSGGMLVGF